jgi:hypothetical protein
MSICSCLQSSLQNAASPLQQQHHRAMHAHADQHHGNSRKGLGGCDDAIYVRARTCT